ALELLLAAEMKDLRSGCSNMDGLPKAKCHAESILADIAGRGWISGDRSGTEGPGLMTGISGLGYQMLRMAEPASVPSILTLEPPVTT
ncbi:MAG: lanthionine synthetase LanC family protein, partial [Pseudomonadota bacterium]